MPKRGACLLDSHTEAESVSDSPPPDRLAGCFLEVDDRIHVQSLTQRSDALNSCETTLDRIMRVVYRLKPGSNEKRIFPSLVPMVTSPLGYELLACEPFASKASLGASARHGSTFLRTSAPTTAHRPPRIAIPPPRLHRREDPDPRPRSSLKLPPTIGGEHCIDEKQLGGSALRGVRVIMCSLKVRLRSSRRRYP